MQMLSNAVHFTPQGGILVEVNALETNAGRVLIQLDVVDTGVGMSSELLKRIARFAPEEDFLPADRGEGLGLPICMHIVSRMQGALRAASLSGQGTLLRFTFPMPLGSVAAVAPDPQEERSIFAVVEQPELPPPTEELPVASNTVLILEEDDEARATAAALLTRLGCAAQAVSDSQEALQRLAHVRYVAVFVTYPLPSMEDVRAVAELQNQLGMRHTPMVAMANYMLPETRERLLSAGLTEALEKPLREEAVRALLTRLGLPCLV
jgi:CheY-like chemotaxis protein